MEMHWSMSWEGVSYISTQKRAWLTWLWGKGEEAECGQLLPNPPCHPEAPRGLTFPWPEFGIRDRNEEKDPWGLAYFRTLLTCPCPAPSAGVLPGTSLGLLIPQPEPREGSRASRLPFIGERENASHTQRHNLPSFSQKEGPGEGVHGRPWSNESNLRGTPLAPFENSGLKVCFCKTHLGNTSNVDTHKETTAENTGH